MELQKISPVLDRSVQATLLLVALLLAGCASPIGVKQVSPRDSYADSMANPLTQGVTSNAANIVLWRFDLAGEFEREPAAVVKLLHEQALRDPRADTLYALAELSYLTGERLGKSTEAVDQYRAPNYFLLSAIYAYLFLLDDREEPPNGFDIRVRTAADLYNFALWRGMTRPGETSVRLSGGVRNLPVGSVAITLDLTRFPFQFRDFSRFEPADGYAIRGIFVRNRVKGIGSALIGVKKVRGESLIQPPVPLSMLLRIDGNLEQLTKGTATASLELYSGYAENVVEIQGRQVPIETDTTTPMAYGLESSRIWDFGLGAFLGKEYFSIPNGLYMSQPYQRGRIPVVFVHGTFSNPAWWAEMFNTLYADPVLRQRYQFWYFLYNSSAPVLVSAADLRDALRRRIAELDPDGKDSALSEMVVIGHSQGGLLTKLVAVDTGELLVQALTGKGIEELQLGEKQKAEARRVLVVEPVAEVKRVVFISAPHRGSILSKNWVRSLIQKVVTLPVKIVETVLTLDIYFTDDVRRMMGGGRVPTSIDGMSPENPVLKTMADIPLASGVTGHSIIAVKGDGELQTEDDGVVAYTSAHLDGMESEFIVQSGHSCQGHPFTIEEVRRILLEHLESEDRAAK